MLLWGGAEGRSVLRRMRSEAVDGGYYDNFGALTAENTLDGLGTLWNGGPHPHVIVIQITSDPDLGGGADNAASTASGNEPTTDQDRRWLFGLSGLAFWRKGYFERYYHATSDLLDMQAAQFGFGPEAQPNPLAILLRTRDSTGLGTVDRLRIAAEGPPYHCSYYHFSMIGARREPLGWSLSHDAREELNNVLHNDHNLAEMNRFIKELEGTQTAPLQTATP